jgi:hypothetical protein
MPPPASGRVPVGESGSATVGPAAMGVDCSFASASASPLGASVRGPRDESRRPLERPADATVRRSRPDGWCSSFSTVTPGSRRASATPARAALASAGLATAGVCRVVTTPGSARAAGRPRFVTEQVRALDHPTPCWWRSRTAGRSRVGRGGVPADGEKQGNRLDGRAVVSVDDAPSCEFGDEQGPRSPSASALLC